MSICKRCDKEFTATHGVKKHCDKCVKEKKAEKNRLEREERKNMTRYCQCGAVLEFKKSKCDECKKENKRIARGTGKKKQRDPNSTAARLLARLGKPRSYIERCY